MKRSAAADLVVILTDHDDVDYDRVAKPGATGVRHSPTYASGPTITYLYIALRRTSTCDALSGISTLPF